MTKYVWIILLLSTLYLLYINDNEKVLGININNILNDKIIPVLLTLHKYILTLLPSSAIANNESGDKIYTENELRRYSNSRDGLYLAILGKIYDVTKGERHYGPGGSYHSFVGRDASLAFITGDFTDEGLTDDVSSLTPSQLKSLNDWAMFYAKDYSYKGKLLGRYYDSGGNPTIEYEKIQDKLALAEKQKSDEEQRQKLFPPCNIEWEPDVGTRVWCSKRSGGIEREWVGVPRMLYELGSEEYRCTCVNLGSKTYETHKGNLREYEGCAEGSTSCIVKTS